MVDTSATTPALPCNDDVSPQEDDDEFVEDDFVGEDDDFEILGADEVESQYDDGCIFDILN